jgi:Trypsin-like peptidase domain
VFHQLLSVSSESLQPVYLTESFYHSIQLHEQVLMAEDYELGARLHLQQDLINRMDDDEDISSMLEGIRETSAENFLKSLSLASKNPGPLPPVNDLESRYCANVVALVDSAGSVLGTGFQVKHNAQVYIVTCAHVVDQGIGDTDQDVRLRTFEGNHTFTGRVVWRLPREQRITNTHASQDVAILETRLDAKAFEPLPLQRSSSLDGLENCRCYGFGISRKSVGAWIRGITCYEQNAGKFVSVRMLNPGPTDALFEKGYSGAPLYNPFDPEGVIAGMIVLTGAKGLESEAVMIPAHIILTLLSNIH